MTERTLIFEAIELVEQIVADRSTADLRLLTIHEKLREVLYQLEAEQGGVLWDAPLIPVEKMEVF